MKKNTSGKKEFFIERIKIWSECQKELEVVKKLIEEDYKLSFKIVGLFGAILVVGLICSFFVEDKVYFKTIIDICTSVMLFLSGVMLGKAVSCKVISKHQTRLNEMVQDSRDLYAYLEKAEEKEGNQTKIEEH